MIPPICWCIGIFGWVLVLGLAATVFIIGGFIWEEVRRNKR